MKIPAAVSLLLLASLSAPAQQKPEPPQASGPAAQSSKPAGKKTPDRAMAYYHYSLAHMYEELVAIYGRSEFASKAIEHYRQAIENDPGSEFLNAGLAELYAKTGRIRDAVLEAQEILKRDPKNLEARKLLGRIYLRSLGDTQSGTQSQEILRLATQQFEKIAELEPNKVDNHLLLGRLYRLNNELLKAEAAFQKAVGIEPGSEEAVTSLAILYTEEGDTAKAVEVLKNVPESERTAKIHSVLGFAYEQQKDYDKAIAAYQQALLQDSDNLDAMRGLAQNLLNAGQTQKALEQYRIIAEADPQDAQALLRMAEIQRRSGEFEQALANLNRAETLVPDSLEVPYSRGLVYEAQGRYDEAAQTFQQLLEKTEKPLASYNPGERNNRSVFLERLGTAYREMRKPEPALETFRKMIELGGEHATRAYQHLIDTHREARQYEQATAVAREAVANFPEERGLQLVLAGQRADMGEAEAALSQVRSMLKGTPEDREVYIALAQIHSRLKQWPEAEEAIAQAQKLSSKPEERDYVAFLHASMLERQKKYDPAEDLFRELLQRDPNNPMVLNYLGYMLADRGVKLQEALELIKKAVEQEPQNAAYLDSLGWAYFRLGNYELAEEYLRRAVDRLPTDPTIHEHLADLYQKMGRLRLAAVHWERALAEWKTSLPADVDPAEVASVQKKLESAKIRLAQQQNKE